jgi:hypothetical protein
VKIQLLLAALAALAPSAPLARAPSLAPGGDDGGPTIVRRDIEIPWGCAGLTSVTQIERVPGEIRRIVAVACVYTTCGDVLRIPPFIAIVGPTPLTPTLTVRRFVIEDEEVFARLEGDGLATFWGDRLDGAGPLTCSGARLHLFIEMEG